MSAAERRNIPAPCDSHQPGLVCRALGQPSADALFLASHSTSRHTLAVEGAGKGFGKFTDEEFLKLRAASPRLPNTKPVGAFLPCFSLKLFLSIPWIKQKKQLLC